MFVLIPGISKRRVHWIRVEQWIWPDWKRQILFSRFHYFCFSEISKTWYWTSLSYLRQSYIARCIGLFSSWKPFSLATIKTWNLLFKIWTGMQAKQPKTAFLEWKNGPIWIPMVAGKICQDLSFQLPKSMTNNGWFLGFLLFCVSVIIK